MNKIKKWLCDKWAENWKLFCFSCFAIFFFITILALLIDWSDRRATLSAVFGGLFGWALGVVSAPYDKSERDKFSAFWAALLALITGFGAGKSDDILKIVFRASNATHLAGQYVSYSLFCAACLVLGFLVAYVFRIYAE